MSKQGLAESMAEYCGWAFVDGLKVWRDCEDKIMPIPEQYFFPCQENEFNPEGFTVVWDKLDERKPKNTLKFYNYGNGECGCFLDEMDTIGPDRYTAFYSAVHEMTNQRSVEG